MAEKKIIWKQKVGDGFDIIFPQTTADMVTYNGGTVEGALNNIGTNLEDKFVKKTGDTMTGSLSFSFAGGKRARIANTLVGFGDAGEYPAFRLENTTTRKVVTYYENGIDIVTGGATNIRLLFPDKSGTFLVSGDIPDITVSTSGGGNAITAISVDATNKHKINVTKDSTFATTATATQSANGLMSSTDKKNLDDMWTLFGTTAGDPDELVNTVREVLKVFENFPEGTDIAKLLESKADASTLNNYVPIEGDAEVGGTKSFEVVQIGHDGGTFLSTDEGGVTTAEISAGFNFDFSGSLRGLAISGNYGTKGQVLTSNGEDSAPTWSTVQIPTSLPPSGNAGGDLTGTYPNPTIGAGKVTEGKIGAGAVTEGKIGANAVTTAKIKDANVTNAKLDTTGVTAGSYSVLTVNAQGRATAGYQLFTIGTSSTIPASVPTGGFYLQEVA